MPFLEQKGIRLFYEERGNGEPGLVFVHGFSCTHEDWKYQLDHFSRGYLIVAPDLRGHGYSDPDPGHTDINTCARDIITLIRSLKLGNSVLIGHSMGCRVVLQAYLDSPQKIAGLVLVDSSRAHSTGKPEDIEEITCERIRTTGYRKMMDDFFNDMFFGNSEPALKKSITERTRSFPEETGTRLFANTVAWDASRLETALSNIKVPVLVIQSTYVTPERKRISLKKDDTNPWLDLVKSKVPEARISIVEGVGHFPMLEDPERINSLISGFLAGFAYSGN